MKGEYKILLLQDFLTIILNFRSVRRWKERLNKAKDEPGPTVAEVFEKEKAEPPKRILRAKKAKVEPIVEQENEEEDELADQEASSEPSKKKRRMYVDREKVQYARELIENKLSNKEMSLLLEMSIACVRKLKTKILNGTVDELIDDSEEHYSNLEKNKDELSKLDPDADPLQFMDSVYEDQVASTSSFVYERKPKAVLREREMFIARLLRESNIRTMDIAKLMKISERSVTRLLTRARESTKTEYDQEVIDEVDRLLLAKDHILNEIPFGDLGSGQTNEPVDDSKRQLGINLLAMNVKTKDIAKMLDVTERTVNRWKVKVKQISKDDDGDGKLQKTNENDDDDDDDDNDDVVVCEEYIYD